MLLPWALRMLTALTGYLVSFRLLVDLTACIASTTMSAKKSESAPMILLDMDVLAMLMRDSRPRSSTLMLTFSFKYLIASRRASLYPVMIVVGCIRFFISSFPRRRSSAAIRTTEVVPSPTSLSCCCARSTRILPAGCSTSRRLRIVAPSLVTVTS